MEKNDHEFFKKKKKQLTFDFFQILKQIPKIILF